MSTRKPFVNISHLPDNLFAYQDEQFYDFVTKYIGKKQANLLRFEDVSSADIYLTCDNVLDLLKLDSAVLLPFKESLCLKLDDESFVVLPGIESSFAYLTELLMKKKEEIARVVRQGRSVDASSNLSISTTVNINNATTISTSPSTVLSTSQTNINIPENVKTIDHHKKHIISTLKEWINKNKKKLGDNNFNLAEGIDYHVNVTVDPDKAIIQCSCGVKSTLQLARGNYQIFNYYRHLKTKKCTMMKSKCSSTAEEEDGDLMNFDEENSVNSPQAISFPTASGSTVLSSQKRNVSFASSQDQSFKKKRTM